MEVTGIRAIPPGADWMQGEGERILPGPHIPTGITMNWHPNPAYPGQFGELPFSDPLWKIIGWVVAGVAAVVGIIAAAAGAGTFNPGVKGKYDDTATGPVITKCCTPDPGGTVQNNATTVAGIASVITTGGIVVGCADHEDPVLRGQRSTIPGPGELTIAENVTADWEYVQPPNAGDAYTTRVRWTYERVTTGRTYEYGVEEEQVNLHTVGQIDVETPDRISLADNDPLWVRARFHRPDGTLFAGAEVYGLCFFRSPGPGGAMFQASLTDDGIRPNEQAGDGIYTASLEMAHIRQMLEEYQLDPEGIWQVHIYAQEVNRGKPGTEPLVAAQSIGGFVLASPVTITFDPGAPCPLRAQGEIAVA